MKMKKMLAGAGLACVVYAGSFSGAIAHGDQQGKHGKQQDKAVTIAHRGLSAYAPEHTMASYQLAKNLNADYLEIDLQMTKDGKLIAMHDTTVNRTTDGKGQVKDLTLKEIKQLDAGSWFNQKNPDRAKAKYEGLEVPTLEEIFKKFGKNANYYIETKSPSLYPEMENELVRLIEKYKLADSKNHPNRVVIQSFSKESLLNIHELNPELPLVQLISYKNPAVATDAEIAELKSYAVGAGMNYRMIDEAYVKKMRDAGLWVHPYTVNDPADMQKLLDWGVNGMFTDYADVLKKVLKQQKENNKKYERIHQ